MTTKSILFLCCSLISSSSLISVMGFAFHQHSFQSFSQRHHRHPTNCKSPWQSHYHFSVKKGTEAAVSLTALSMNNDVPIMEDSDNNYDLSNTSTDRERMQENFSFPLDKWQFEAGSNIESGKNVILCAPTGAGKTVVGEMALYHARSQNLRAIYTTPLKALSNQKFVELRKLFGAEAVGLSTGDMCLNRGAPITVMTTEVYRNMAWRASYKDENENENDGDTNDDLYDDLSQNAVVVLDEFHYMGQPGRGGVWEESVIITPAHTQIVALSATLTNANDLSQWMASVTNRDTALVEAGTTRPVPLRYLFANKKVLTPLFKDANAGPGSPNGLLGFRGDGIPATTNNKDNDDNAGGKTQKLPKGLSLNPVLTNEAKKRSDKIHLAVQQKIERMDTEHQRSNNRYESDVDTGGKKKKHKSKSKRDTFVKPRSMSARDQRRERERLQRVEMKKSVPTIHSLVQRLEERDLLPAIFFIFSRVGCDNAAEQVSSYMNMLPDGATSSGKDIDNFSDGSSSKKNKKSRQRSKRKENLYEDDFGAFDEQQLMKDTKGRNFRAGSSNISSESFESIFENAKSSSSFSTEDPQETTMISASDIAFASRKGLLTQAEVTEVADKVRSFNQQNPEIAISYKIVNQYLMGVGSHHAGMLSAHKTLVETLFRAQLMRVVFATETLAAGINMPARTTVISSLAKRGFDGNINLLETSNLLQMAGRAGRRGMDTNGTCVLVQTPFEGPEEASQIIVSEVLPIQSQFSPSYPLAVNLIARGGGELEVARALVQKSFAMWEKNQRERNNPPLSDREQGVTELLDERTIATLHVQFLSVLSDTFLKQLDKTRDSRDSSKVSKKLSKMLEAALAVLTSAKGMKKSSKSYIGISRMLQDEKDTLAYLEIDSNSQIADILGMSGNEEMDDIFDGLFADLDEASDEAKTSEQQVRVQQKQKVVDSHIFTQIVALGNAALGQKNEDGDLIGPALSAARAAIHNNEISSDHGEAAPLTTNELVVFTKSQVDLNRMDRKSKLDTTTASPFASLLNLDEADDESNNDATWDEMISLIDVLGDFGCLKCVDHDSNPMSSNNQAKDVNTLKLTEKYEVTEGGKHVGMLGFSNSLWCLAAMGGVWDCAGTSVDIDKFKAAMDNWDNDDVSFDDAIDNYDDVADIDPVSNAEKEAHELVSQLRLLSPSEMAGYVSCLVGEESRGGPGDSSIAMSFEKLSDAQRDVIRSAVIASERLVEVQKFHELDRNSNPCELVLSMSDVVTAWTAGCTWSEALEMSGKAPGDLARLLHRSLDALRQLGNLPYNAVRVRNENYPSEPPGIHPEIRRICKDAAMDMARYPLKDPLPFDEEENVDDETEEDNVDEEAEEKSPNDVIAENPPDDAIEGESLSHDITG